MAKRPEPVITQVRPAGAQTFGFLSLLGILGQHFHRPDMEMAEVGAYAGETTKMLAKSHLFSVIYAVDTWKQWSEPAEPLFDLAVRPYLSRVSYPRVHKVKMTPVNAAYDFFRSSLDFVYIDAAKDLTGLREAIAAWTTKVRAGGFIGGAGYDPSWPGVITHVNEVFGIPHYTFRDGSWLVRMEDSDDMA